MNVEQHFKPYVLALFCLLERPAHLRSNTVGPLAAQAFDVDQAFRRPSAKLFYAVAF
jgi:hypothetical protein